jgi:hypothetical protein
MILLAVAQNCWSLLELAEFVSPLVRWQKKPQPLTALGQPDEAASAGDGQTRCANGRSPVHAGTANPEEHLVRSPLALRPDMQSVAASIKWREFDATGVPRETIPKTGMQTVRMFRIAPTRRCLHRAVVPAPR